MNRSNMISELHAMNVKLSLKDIDDLVKKMFHTMTNAIIADQRIEIRGFGCFSLKHRVGGIIRNPKSGVLIKSNGRRVVYFRAGKELKLIVNSSLKSSK